MHDEATTLDAVNALLQLGGAAATWANAARLWRDRVVAGVEPASMVFFAAWGVWNVYYFWQLGQWLSVAGGALLCAGNLLWVALALRVTLRRRQAGA